MVTSNVAVAVALAYVFMLFVVAALAERGIAAGRLSFLRSPLVYTLSLSVYCTGWTFYGAVGSAVRNGLEFAAIYIGPTLLFVGWFAILRKLVRIGRLQRTTSIADFISSRYGKSNGIAMMVTLLAVMASTPYIALQLQSITVSFDALTAATDGGHPDRAITAFWVAAGLAVFTILFGTRNVDVNERHDGVVTAIAVEAIVKLAALIAVGLFVVFWVNSGPSHTFDEMPDRMLTTPDGFGPRWYALNLLSAMAILTLPRMFHVMVVENADERHLRTASWAFPLYVFLISLFVLPIAVAGLSRLPEGSNPDLFVLTLPLAEGQAGLALFAFIGGFSAATSMVIVSSIAVSTMISNHLVMPVWLYLNRDRTISSGDVRTLLLTSRRVSIISILALGLLYFRLSGGGSELAAIGLIAFAGMAQLVPALLAGIFWRGATRAGAGLGLFVGAALWAYTLLLPSFGGSFLMSEATIAQGPFGIAILSPQAFLGLDGLDPLVHALFWSMAGNVTALVAGSLFSRASELERLQGALFVDVFRHSDEGASMTLTRTATSEDLFTLAQRILGATPAYELFVAEARGQGKSSGLPDPTPGFIEALERRLAGSMGSASAHAMVSQIAGGGTISVDDLMNIADETAQILQYSQALETQSKELEDTASQLRRANERLRALSDQKDAFLSQVSHELRTPMTSVRSFADILQSTEDLTSQEARRFIGIIGQESQRLTRILDEILDLSFLESGKANWQLSQVRLADVIERARQGTAALLDQKRSTFHVEGGDLVVMADFDRLSQVFINLFSNALKYGHPEAPVITVTAQSTGDTVMIDIHDNGPGIAPEDRTRVFEKFSRLAPTDIAGSAGLGLPISREIVRNLGGDLVLTDLSPGTTFRVTLKAGGTRRS